MGYRVWIRGGIGRKGGMTVSTAIRTTENMLRSQYNEIWKNHVKELEEIAEYIEEDARYLVPKETGRLEDSINVYVTKSRRYPGIIASAYANSGGKPGLHGYKGFDYALIQEENEDYSHDEPEESAHYLGGPFVLHIAQLYKSITGKPLNVSQKMKRAYLYVKDKI